MLTRTPAAADSRLFVLVDSCCPIGRGAATIRRWYFGRWLCDGNREVLDKMALKHRAYIGPTSLDVVRLVWCGSVRSEIVARVAAPAGACVPDGEPCPSMRTLACSLALPRMWSRRTQARPGSFVYDPFVGTGSVIIAAAKMGCETLGADIDHRILRGRDGADVGANFSQYALGVPECVLNDNANS